MASPHVAGVAALYLADNPSATPAAVHAAVVNNASVDKLTSIGTGSPNRLLYSIFSTAPADRSRRRWPPSHSCVRDDLHVRWQRLDRRARHLRLQLELRRRADRLRRRGQPHRMEAAARSPCMLTVTDTAGQTRHRVAVRHRRRRRRSVHELPGVHRHAVGNRRLRHPTERHLLLRATWRARIAAGCEGRREADFDLYLQKWNGFSWVTVARSESVTSVEQIAFNGTPRPTTAGASPPSAAAEATRSGCSGREPALAEDLPHRANTRGGGRCQGCVQIRASSLCRPRFGRVQEMPAGGLETECLQQVQ